MKNYTLNTYLQIQAGPFKILKYTRSQLFFFSLLQACLFLSKNLKILLAHEIKALYNYI